MNILIAGGSGFIGRYLHKQFSEDGHSVTILSRKKNSINHCITWKELNNSVNEWNVIINLAGEGINSGRWTEKRKKSILESRTSTTEKLVQFIKQHDENPPLLINGSAIGIYGNSTTETFTETSPTVNDDFLAHVVQEWEKCLEPLNNDSYRYVICRFGIVLGKDGGALPRMALPYHLFAGGTIGSGKQWVSWITLEDIYGLMKWIIENPTLHGVFNFTAPNPVTMKECGKIIGSVLNRPHWLPAPSFAFQLAFGEMSTLLLDGQRVLPQHALENGYTFQFPSLKEALQHIYK